MNTDQQRVLDEAISEIKRDTETDANLLNILVKHIVTLSPAENALDQATEEIEKLANERAES